MIAVEEMQRVLTEHDEYYRDCVSVGKQSKRIESELNNCITALESLQNEVLLLQSTCSLSKNVSKSLLDDTLTQICMVVNKAVAVLFNDGVQREISIESTLYSHKYPHFNVILKVKHDEISEPIEQNWETSGDGLGQLVSFLMNLCILDKRDSHFIVLDESFNGFSVTVMKKFLPLLQGFSDKFQFLVVEHGIPQTKFGQHYAIGQKNGISKIFNLHSEKESTHYYDEYKTSQLIYKPVTEDILQKANSVKEETNY